MKLPIPDPAFHWTDEVWGHALRCRPLTAAAQHVFTSKQLPLPEPEAWRAALTSVGAAPERLMRVKQVHGNIVRVLKAGEVPDDAHQRRPDGDAIVSNVAGHALAVMVADCVPILICDPVRGAVAAIHAGWRGTCARVVPAAVEAMRQAFHTDPADLIVAIGPSVGAADYEVGPSLITAFLDAGHERSAVDRWFIQDGPKPHLDLWRANTEMLLQSGLNPRQLFQSGLSTVSHPDVFDSYRVDGECAGRMAGIIVVPPPA